MTNRWFRPSPPSPQASDVLVCRWTASGTGRHLLIPDGSMELVWVDDGRLWLCGPDTTSWTIDLGTAGASVGVRFRPGAAAHALRVHAVDLVDRRVPLDAVIGSRAARMLGERIDDADNLHARMVELERQVTVGAMRTRWADHGTSGDRAIHAAVDTLAVCDRRVDQLAAQTDLSPRQLQRRFVRHVGYPPSQFARIARLQRFMHRASIDHRSSLADLAAAVGYADQSHLSRDCKAIAGITPSHIRAGVADTSHAPPDLVDTDVRSVQDSAHPRGQKSAA